MRSFLLTALGGIFLIGNYGVAAESKLKTLPDMVRALKNSEDKNLRALAAKRIRELGTAGKAAVGDLIGALRDNDEKVRREARRALAAIGPAAVPELRRALNTKNQIVRNHIV